MYNLKIYLTAIISIWILSLDLEVGVWDELSLNSVLCDIKKTDATTWGAVSEACKCDDALDEFLDLMLGHVFTEVSIDVTPHESTTRAAECPVALFEVAWRVDLVDLISLIRIPSTADHTCRQTVLVWVNDLTHHVGSWLNWREVTQLITIQS